MASNKDTYDFIVVGAGPAGCALASRLANSPSRPTVLLVEAGGDNSDPGLRVPFNKYVQFMTPSQAWGYQSTPQESLGGREIILARGKGLGGSSAVNFSCWTVGPRDDMDEMARLTGDEAWAWERALGRWRSLENYHAPVDAHVVDGGPKQQERPTNAAKYLRPDPNVHGTSGPLHVGIVDKWDHEMTEMMDIWEASGYTLNPDQSDGTQLGFAVTPNTENRGVRVTAEDLLHPTPDNLEIVTNAPVHRVLIEDGRAVGIKIMDGVGREFRAAKEVVLCAGSMDTPKLLMHSGIGPADQLRDFGIPLLRDLPGVGGNYVDHYHVVFKFVRRELNHSAGGSSTSWQPGLFGDAGRRKEAKRDWDLYRTGEYATRGVQLSLGFLKSPAVQRSAEFAALPPAEQERLLKPTIPTYEVSFNVPAMDYLVSPDTAAAIGTVCVFLMNSQGRGSFRLQSADPAVPLAFSPDFLRHPYDRRVAVEATREVLAVTRGERFLESYARPLDVPASDAEEDILAFWRDNLSTTFHMSGTAKIATAGEAEKDGACVDAEFRVLGMQGLRVADMSIMPFIVSCHTQSTAYQIGMIAAEKLIDEYKLGA